MSAAAHVGHDSIAISFETLKGQCTSLTRPSHLVWMFDPSLRKWEVRIQKVI
jgi:hypothetical protein